MPYSLRSQKESRLQIIPKSPNENNTVSELLKTNNRLYYPYPQLMNNKICTEITKVYDNQKTTLVFEIRNTVCVVCGTLQKPSSLDKIGKCKGKSREKHCKLTIYDSIPPCIRNLTIHEQHSLRLLKIYANHNFSNSYMYAKYKGTLHLSVNWLVWQLCAGFIGINNTYNKKTKVMNAKVKKALKWLIENNNLYHDFMFPTETLDYFVKSDINVFARASGEVFTTLANIDQNELGKDDSNFKVLPVGELIKNGSKEVISFSKDKKDAYIFPYLYPKGNQYISNKTTARAMEVKNRMFNLDPRFRECTDWLFFILIIWKSIV